MKRLLIHLEDEEYEKLYAIKQSLKKSWKDTILYLASRCSNLEEGTEAKYLKRELEEIFDHQIGKTMSRKHYLALLAYLLMLQEEDAVPEDHSNKIYSLIAKYILERLNIKGDISLRDQTLEEQLPKNKT